MKLRKCAPLLLAVVLFLSSISITYHSASAGAIAGTQGTGNSRPASLGVGDFFLTEAELPAPWIPDPTPYTPGAHMRVKEKLMGGQWGSVRIKNTDTTIHMTIGYFPSEAEASKNANPDTYIFRTDAYMETGQTFTDLMQRPNSQYSLTGGTIYGDGGFSGGYQHGEIFQPFNVFYVGQVLFEIQASNPSGVGAVEALLVNKARRLLNIAAPPESGLPTATADASQPPTLTPQVQANPILLKASMAGKGEATQTIPNSNNLAVVTISGIVTDQDGNGLSGAAITVVSGADAASSITNPDGSYSLTLNVPSGQGSGALQGINFTLQVGDLSIDRVVLLQAIEGGQLVTNRDVGVRVFLNWGLDQPVDVEVTITVDNQALAPVRGIARKSYTQADRNRGTDAVNIIIPKAVLPSWGDSSHTLTAAVAIVSPNMVDTDPSNNVSALQNFSLKNTRALNILYVSLDPNIGKAALVSFAARAHSFLDKVYPIPYSYGFVGAQGVNYYLVSPYVGFMKSLDPDDLPFNLGDIGIVEGGVEVGKSFSYKSAIIAIEKARRLYNTQRCKDTQGKLILPCPDEIALQAVGVYPDGAFGSSKDGFAYVDHRVEWRAAANSQVKPDNVAHELGHLFGFGEEYNSTTPGVPVNGSTWDGVWFRTADGSCVNLMGNVAMACTWINAQTWNSLIDNSLQYGAPGAQAVASRTVFAPHFEPLPGEVQGPALIVEGVVTSAGKGFIDRVSTVDRYQRNENSNVQFKLEAWDAGGNSLGGEPFEGIFFDLDVNPVSASPFLVVLPVLDPNQVAEVTIRTPDDQIIDSMSRSASAPQVSFDPLPAAIQDQATLTWQASDVDGDPLRSTLYYSNNGGLSWQLLGIDMPVTSFSLNAAELPGGSAVFKVSVSDGFNSAESVSTSVSMPDQPPIVTILAPWGTEFENQAIVSLEAAAYDLEDGLLPASAIQWFDAQGALLGSGTLLQTTGLNGGSSRISVQAQDSTGKISEAGIDISITGAPPATSMPVTTPATSVPVTTPSTNLPVSIPSTNLLYLLGACACGSLLGGSVLAGGVYLFTRRRRAARMPGAAPWVASPQPEPAQPTRRSSSCLLTMIAGGLMALIVVGGISIIAFGFFPAYKITFGQGDFTQILKMGGGGLLVTALGLLLLNGGFKAILTRRAIANDEWGRRREKRGCAAILSGFGQLIIGLLLLAGGLGWITLVFYQEILPWLGF